MGLIENAMRWLFVATMALGLSGCPEGSTSPSETGDASIMDATPSSADEGMASDGTVSRDASGRLDASPVADGALRVDGAPEPDAAPVIDGSLDADVDSETDVGSQADSAPMIDAAPVPDAAPVVDAAPIPDAAPDWGPPPENLRRGSWTGHVTMGGSMWGSGWQFPFGYGLSYYTRVFRPLDSVPAGGQMGLTSQWLSTPVDTDTCGADYQTIEGGLFIREHVTGPSHFPKFMIGTGNHCYNGFSTVAYGWGYNERPISCEHMGFAALSNRLLLSPTGTSFSSMQRSRNTFLGVGWIPLPIMRPAVRPASQLVDDRTCVWCERGHRAPEGNACDGLAIECDGTWYPDGLGGLSWTLFFDTANFKGPVGFFIDEYWLRDVAADVNPLATLANTGFEHTPSMGMEFNGLPAFIANQFVKTPRMRFPNELDQEPLVLDIRMYGIDLYNKFVGFMQGEPDPLDPRLDEHFTALRAANGGVYVRLEENGRETYTYTTDQANFEIEGVEMRRPAEAPAPGGCGPMDVTVGVFDHECCAGWDMQACNRVETHFFLNWIDERQRDGAAIPLPVTDEFAQYFRRVQIPGGEPRLQLEVLAPDEVPDGLRGVTYGETPEFNTYPPHDPEDYPCWAGGLDGEHEVTLEDGGQVVYKWYRFIDQPAFASYNLDEPTRMRLQTMAERVHREWTIDRTYLSPPSTVDHDLVQVEEALIVQPPEGRDWADMVGYVPIPLYTRYPDGRGADNHGCAEDYNGVRHCW